MARLSHNSFWLAVLACSSLTLAQVNPPADPAPPTSDSGSAQEYRYPDSAVVPPIPVPPSKPAVIQIYPPLSTQGNAPSYPAQAGPALTFPPAGPEVYPPPMPGTRPQMQHFDYGQREPIPQSGPYSYEAAAAQQLRPYVDRGYGLNAGAQFTTPPPLGLIQPEAWAGGIHERFPYYSYRRPWYTPGQSSLNVTIVW